MSLFGAAVLMGNHISNKQLQLQVTSGTLHVVSAHKQERMMGCFRWILWMGLVLICRGEHFSLCSVCVQIGASVTNTFCVSVQVSLQESDYYYEDFEEPTNCSVAEKIKGGHVTYSQVECC